VNSYFFGNHNHNNNNIPFPLPLSKAHYNLVTRVEATTESTTTEIIGEQTLKITNKMYLTGMKQTSNLSSFIMKGTSYPSLGHTQNSIKDMKYKASFRSSTSFASPMASTVSIFAVPEQEQQEQGNFQAQTLDNGKEYQVHNSFHSRHYPRSTMPLNMKKYQTSKKMLNHSKDSNQSLRCLSSASIAYCTSTGLSSQAMSSNNGLSSLANIPTSLTAATNGSGSGIRGIFARGIRGGSRSSQQQSKTRHYSTNSSNSNHANAAANNDDDKNPNSNIPKNSNHSSSTTGNVTQQKNEVENDKDKNLKHGAKALFKEYGPVAVVTYLGVYVVTLSSIFLLYDNGFSPLDFGGDSNSMMTKVVNILNTTETTSKLIPYIETNPHAANFALAWITTKFTEPVRLVLTLAIVPRIAKMTKSNKLKNKD
jgi:hypothetical protein